MQSQYFTYRKKGQMILGSIKRTHSLGFIPKAKKRSNLICELISIRFKTFVKLVKESLKIGTNILD